MKLPELLKAAVLNEDWFAVCAVYTAITGEELSPPEKKPKEPDLLNLEIDPSILAKLGLKIENNDSQEYDAPPEFPEDDDDEPPPERRVVKEETEEEVENRYLQATVSDDEPRQESSQAQEEPDFRLRRSNEDGGVETKKQDMYIPEKGKRPNKFKDDKKVASQDLKANNPVLAEVYSKTSRVDRNLIEGATDTGKDVVVECSLCGEASRVAVGLSRGYHQNKELNTYKCVKCSTPSGRTRALRKQRELELNGGGRKRS